MSKFSALHFRRFQLLATLLFALAIELQMLREHKTLWMIWLLAGLSIILAVLLYFFPA
jgi:hypothetical protein